MEFRKCQVLVTFFLLLLINVCLANSQAKFYSSVSLVGYAACDRCLDGGFTNNISPLSGVKVQVQCKNNAGSITYSTTQVTDKQGSFHVDVPTSIAQAQTIKNCASKVVEALPHPCNNVVGNLQSTPVPLYLKQSMKTSHQIYAAGLFMYKPDKAMLGCPVKKLTQENVEKPFPFFPAPGFGFGFGAPGFGFGGLPPAFGFGPFLANNKPKP